MSEWVETLDGLLDGAWACLERGVAETDDPLHLASLASTGLGGGAEARMVVMRGADRRHAVLETHTDRASRKVDELSAVPLASFLLWHPGQSLQIRARVRVEILTDEDVQGLWDSLSDHARRNYGGDPPPSTPLAAAEDYTETAERDRLTVLRGHVTSLDLLHFGEIHRRALYEAEDGFKGLWLAP